MIKKDREKTRHPKEPGLPRIESYLESTFKPVSPRPDFVVNLRSRLDDPDFINQKEISDLDFVLLAVGAVIVTFLLIAGLIKLIIEIAGASHILNLTGRQADVRNHAIGQDETS